MKNPDLMAKLTIHQPSPLTPTGVTNVVAWLRRLANDIKRSPHLFSKRYTVRLYK